MIKKNLKTLIITSLIILCPIVIGLIFWSSLPAQIPTHWNAAGEIDRYSSKAFAIFGLPLFLLAIHWIGLIATNADKGNKDQHKKPMTMVLWICPIISVLVFAIIYATAMGMDANMTFIMPLLLGVMFVVVGNYLPKCRRNHTIGIKLPWTINNEENWNKTHRLGGKLWVFGGFLMMLAVLLPTTWLTWYTVIILIVMVVIPTVYSYSLSKK